SINATIKGNKTSVNIDFEIKSGYPDGQFDMDRTSALKTLSLNDAKKLAAKLNEFVIAGERFLSDNK
ncbi:MAG: hypothetical protein WA063_05715, partial [Minisyncoccia bacterium]